MEDDGGASWRQQQEYDEQQQWEEEQRAIKLEQQAMKYYRDMNKLLNEQYFQSNNGYRWK